MPYKTHGEIRRAHKAQITNELWNGNARHHWRKTINTLRTHFHNGDFDHKLAVRLVRNNVEDAYKAMQWYTDEEFLATTTEGLLGDIVYMYESER